jgi:hypothetical protein
MISMDPRYVSIEDCQVTQVGTNYSQIRVRKCRHNFVHLWLGRF